MSSDQNGYSGRTSEPGIHYHNGSAYGDKECSCALSGGAAGPVHYHQGRGYRDESCRCVLSSVKGEFVPVPIHPLSRCHTGAPNTSDLRFMYLGGRYWIQNAMIRGAYTPEGGPAYIEFRRPANTRVYPKGRRL